MGKREDGLRRVALLTAGIAVVGVAGTTLVACTVPGTQQSSANSTGSGTTQWDGSGQSSGGIGISPGSGAGHGRSGGS
ncbi:hypothetical protein FNH05_29505 [Amycolatopsis rhizosphaerae]|uniref:Uncharacterized protein n=1 Tax=Amycolatopsis rhizosphaerae TaxID=2053003 RepID=A0A558B0T3_9PSEU|nr:hypothetical protein [Amycolatopsis rhizosphaerae]TVT30129.1 hypothetical protein FNH05_29505 [Amycolatopsis rhizosphaerae]